MLVCISTPLFSAVFAMYNEDILFTNFIERFNLFLTNAMFELLVPQHVSISATQDIK